MTYLHDELNGTDEETKELEQEVFLLLLHLVETIFPTTLEDLLGCKTNTRVGLEHVLGDDAGATGSDIFFLLKLEREEGIISYKLQLRR